MAMVPMTAMMAMMTMMAMFRRNIAMMISLVETARAAARAENIFFVF